MRTTTTTTRFHNSILEHHKDWLSLFSSADIIRLAAVKDMLKKGLLPLCEFLKEIKTPPDFQSLLQQVLFTFAFGLMASLQRGVR